ncbi:hypothetical protein LFM09_09245 [Lentzea alba]|uniref:hypothetical protein n=1 Tax=Lentzea alba TaxID=2714351 RepID=UPI0039BFD0F6
MRTTHHSVTIAPRTEEVVMATTFWAWAVSAAVILGLAIGIPKALGIKDILHDSRGRYSLTRFQVVVWTVVMLSLMSGMAAGRAIAGQSDVLGFTVPNEVLTLLGISLGSAVVAGAVKVTKSATRPESVAAYPLGQETGKFLEMLTIEEGKSAGKAIDVAKFQNFIITVLLVLGYVVQAAAALRAVPNPAGIGGLPAFSDTFLILLGVSHAGYLLGKLPSPEGTPSVGTMKERLAP